MAKSLLSEGIASAIAKLIFKGHAKRLYNKVKKDPQLKKAMQDFEKASKNLDKAVKNQNDLYKKFGIKD